MPTRTENRLRKQSVGLSRDTWLRKHVDYQRVYRDGKRYSLPLMTYFFASRQPAEQQPPAIQEPGEANVGSTCTGSSGTGSRIGLTAGRVLGNAVQRNRIKRRMREAVRLHRIELSANADVIFHPRRAVLQAPFSEIQRDVLGALRTVQSAIENAKDTSQPPRLSFSVEACTKTSKPSILP